MLFRSQDVLLPDVESGVIALIGATTQNPFFALTTALVSRSRLFELEPLTGDDIAEILRRAVAEAAARAVLDRPVTERR